MPDITTLFEGTEGVSRTLFNQKLSDINTHGKDGNSHITTYLHTKTGSMHDFAGTGSNGKSRITADFVVGDTFTVNGQPVTAKLQNGEQPTGEFFAAGCWVQFIYDNDANQLNFSAGGSKQIPTTYAGKLTVSVAAYDGGSIANTKVRIRNSTLGMDIFYTPDAIGKVTLSLQSNQTYYITLDSVPEPYYGEAATQYIGFNDDVSLALQLKEQPDIVGIKINQSTGIMTYTDGAVNWTEMKMNVDALEPNSWMNSWLIKDIRPCVLKNGVVQYYLKRTGFLQYDYSLQENGLPSDITTGGDGEVYIEHPLVYIKSETVLEGTETCLIIRFTKQPLDGYIAHVHGGNANPRSTVYYPAYRPCLQNNIPAVLSGVAPQLPPSGSTINTFNSWKTNYSQLQIKDFEYIIALFLLLFKSQRLTTLGTHKSFDIYTLSGALNDKPLCWGSSTAFKFLGMENPFNRNFISGDFSYLMINEDVIAQDSWRQLQWAKNPTYEQGDSSLSIRYATSLAGDANHIICSNGLTTAAATYLPIINQVIVPAVSHTGNSSVTKGYYFGMCINCSSSKAQLDIVYNMLLYYTFTSSVDTPTYPVLTNYYPWLKFIPPTT